MDSADCQIRGETGESDNPNTDPILRSLSHIQAVSPIVPIKPLRYRLVWHERSHANRALRWLREEIVAAARAVARRDGS